MIKLKVFSNFCTSEQAINNFKNIYGMNDDNHPYKGKIEFTYGDDYTHALLLNNTYVDLDLPKENVLGLAYEPLEFLGLSAPYVAWAKTKMQHYYLGTKIDDTFINHYGFQWHHCLKDINHTPNKTKPMSIIFSNKKTTFGHQYRWNLVNEILKTNLDIDIYGRGCTTLNSTDSRVKGEFECYEPFKDYLFSICIENTQYDDYMSEKFMDCLIDKTVPVYFGARNSKKYFNDSHIVLTGNVSEDMKLITNICNNTEIYKKDVDSGINELINGKANLMVHLLEKFS